MSANKHFDCVIVGGGVVGLSLAWELAQQGRSVQLLDRSEPGREASWAGAGILPPANRATALHPYDELRGLSMQLHPQWAERLLDLTDIDIGFRRCGGFYLARTAGEAAALSAWAATLNDEQIKARRLTAVELAALEPAIETRSGCRGIFHLPDECQLRNPRYLRALRRACELTGVVIQAGVEVSAATMAVGKMTAVETNVGSISAEQFCFTAGAWTGQLLARLSVVVSVLPIRGQMLLLRSPAPVLRCVVNDGPRYLVPRDDGYLLVGATEEEAGFDTRTTPEALAELHKFAVELVPALADAVVERSWAGLRPASFDGFPYLGRLPGAKNAFVAAGHFRSGLYLSPGTAVVMRQLMSGMIPEINLTPFRVGR